jgi:hypothetical protein
VPKPDFLCIGAQKAGTRWLYDQVAAHPGAWLPPIKELHFFNRGVKRRDRREARRLLMHRGLQLLKRYSDLAELLGGHASSWLEQAGSSPRSSPG